MAKTSGFVTFVTEELFANISGITSRAMFGGYGIYKDGLFFAIIDDDVLYLRVDETNKKDFESYVSKPFTYHTKEGKEMTMSYYELPQAIMDDRDAIIVWVEKAVNVTRNKKSTKSKIQKA